MSLEGRINLAEQSSINSILKEETHNSLRALYFGNTGLVIDAYPHKWVMHFKPDGKRDKVIGRELEYGLRFSLAIDALLKFWNNPDNFNQANLRQDFIIGLTNEAMSSYRKSLFESLNSDLPIYEELEEDDEPNEIGYVLHLDRLNAAIKSAAPEQREKIKYFQRLEKAKKLLPIENE